MNSKKTVARFLVEHYGNPDEARAKRERRERFDRFAEAAGNALAVGLLSWFSSRALSS